MAMVSGYATGGGGNYDVARLAQGRARARVGSPVYGDAPEKPYMPEVTPDPEFERAYQEHVDNGGTFENFDFESYRGARPRSDTAPAAPDQGAAPSSMPQGGSWGANYEWSAPEGGPRVSDIQIGNRDWVTGFNTGGWGSGGRGTESFKNAFGMVASNFDPRDPASLDAMLASDTFRAYFPNAKKVGDDKIDFGDGRAVDVWRNWTPGKGGDAWAFQTGGGSGAPAAAGPRTGSNVSSLMTPAQVRAQLPNERLKTRVNPASGQEEWLFADPVSGEILGPDVYEQSARGGQRPVVRTPQPRGRSGASHVSELLQSEWV